MITKERLCLYLGANNRKLEGFKTMDQDAALGVDYVGDVSDLSRFETGSVSSIVASHILEHFPFKQAPLVLKEWYRVLEPGGILYIAVPDFARAVYLATQHGLNDWLVALIHGDQEYPGAFHFASYDEHRLKNYLKTAGFFDITRVDELPKHAPNDCSMLHSTWDGKSVSLNLTAVK